jgi:hypothetical protein
MRSQHRNLNFPKFEWLASICSLQNLASFLSFHYPGTKVTTRTTFCFRSYAVRTDYFRLQLGTCFELASLFCAANQASITYDCQDFRCSSFFNCIPRCTPAKGFKTFRGSRLNPFRGWPLCRNLYRLFGLSLILMGRHLCLSSRYSPEHQLTGMLSAHHGVRYRSGMDQLGQWKSTSQQSYEGFFFEKGSSVTLATGKVARSP